MRERWHSDFSQKRCSVDSRSPCRSHNFAGPAHSSKANGLRRSVLGEESALGVAWDKGNRTSKNKLQALFFLLLYFDKPSNNFKLRSDPGFSPCKLSNRGLCLFSSVAKCKGIRVFLASFLPEQAEAQDPPAIRITVHPVPCNTVRPTNIYTVHRIRYSRQIPGTDSRPTENGELFLS